MLACWAPYHIAKEWLTDWQVERREIAKTNLVRDQASTKADSKSQARLNHSYWVFLFVSYPTLRTSLSLSQIDLYALPGMAKTIPARSGRTRRKAVFPRRASASASRPSGPRRRKPGSMYFFLSFFIFVFFSTRVHLSYLLSHSPLFLSSCLLTLPSSGCTT